MIDFKKHNEEVKAVWDSYNEGKPIRVPMILGVNARFTLLNPELNPRGITFEEYFADPDLQVHVQLQHQHWVRHNLLQDAEMGLPEEGWGVNVDLQNTYDAGWFGCELRFYPDQVPDTAPLLSDDNKRLLFDRGIPDPLRGGLMAKNMDYYEHMNANKDKYSFAGKPVISVSPSAMETDGPLTVAANVRGATEILLDFYEDPDYARELLNFITEATIVRLKAMREHFGHNMKPECWGFADDSIALISEELYREFVLPCHKRLISELAGAGPHWIHLCGDATRHFPLLEEELNMRNFDTGFPVDFAWLHKNLKPDTQILGGPSVSFLMTATPEEIEKECRRILFSGIMGRKFVLREGNNLSPCTPIENTNAMYAAVKKYGVYTNA